MPAWRSASRSLYWEVPTWRYARFRGSAWEAARTLPIRMRSVQAGSILFVKATSEHSFFEIEEDITRVVFFATGGPLEA